MCPDCDARVCSKTTWYRMTFVRPSAPSSPEPERTAPDGLEGERAPRRPSGRKEPSMSDSTERGTATLVAGEKAHEIEGAPRSDDAIAAGASDVVARQREIQEEVRRDERRQDPKKGGAMQAGAREYPVPPFPEQHQAKPGQEARLEPAPMYDAPFWKGSGKLDGEGRADQRRRLRDRPGGGGAVRARGRGRGDRAPRRGCRCRGDPGGRRGGGTAGGPDARQRRRP